MNKEGKKTLINVGIVVDNIEEAANHFKKIFELEEDLPVNYPDPNKIPKPGAYKKLRGVMVDPKLKSCFVNLDPIYLEVLEPVGEEPSIWKEHLDKHGPSVCFITFHIDGFEQHIDFMEENGYPMNFIAEKINERFAYFDTQDKIGVMIELKENKTR